MPAACKQSRIDAAYEESTKSKRRDSFACEAEVNTVVSKMIYDNLRDLSAEEIDCVTNEEGLTCRGMCRKMQLLSMQEPQAYPIGYNQMRAMFRTGIV